jgi:hypothetical protein
LDAGEVVVGDGGFLFCMEKRGYVKAGPYTPEATVEHPEAGRQVPIMAWFNFLYNLYCNISSNK